ncbi:MAG: LamG domain-containing protein [Verrucomicrobiae bacterium]|nr:LamG domain-containing protein [Verrucomicrobiae bacterium]
MKTKNKPLMTVAIAAGLIIGGIGVAQAVESDTNATTVAYWKFSGVESIPLSPSGNGILDLATNAGQGITPPGTGLAPATVQDLWFQGPLASSPTITSTVPPSSMFNANDYFSAGSGSWDCGADEFSGAGGTLTCDNTTYGNAFNGPDFTFEVYFKSDTTNDPTLGTQQQYLIFDHHQSAYAFIDLNDNAGSDTNQIGGIRFWSWNVAVFGIDCRITAAQNHGHRLDDGQWHYAAARFNEATETMDLLVVNEDGTSAETSTYVTVPLNPGGATSQGPLFLGCDENGNEIFDGQINQIRYSKVSLPTSQLMANATACGTPVFNNTAATNSVLVGDVLTISAASWPVYAQGGPLNLQWQLNGANISGQTNLAASLFPVTAADAGSYQLVATTPCGGISATSAPIVVNVAPKVPVNLVRWSFENVINPLNDATPPVPIAQCGIASVDSFYYPLITFNNGPIQPAGANGGIALTNVVPPASMFINGNGAGTNAFDPSFIYGVNGVVFYPNGSYPGDPFDFRTQFSLELFFQTYGDQSANGTMELICQGSDGGNTFEYGVNINQTANGALSFKVNNDALAPTGPSFEDTNAGIQSVVLSDRNYADGAWHYLLAKYDSTANTISLSVANVDGSGTNATVALPAGYSPLSANNEGNLFIGRYRYPFVDSPASQSDPRTFMGAIDEVQVSSGLVTPATGQLGYLPVPPSITGIMISGNTVTINFTGNAAAAASSYKLVGSPTINGTYSATGAAITSLGGGNFQATINKSGSAEFYRVAH